MLACQDAAAPEGLDATTDVKPRPPSRQGEKSRVWATSGHEGPPPKRWICAVSPASNCVAAAWGDATGAGQEDMVTAGADPDEVARDLRREAGTD